METLLIVMRFVQFLAVMILFGSSLFPYYALRQRELCRADLAAFLQPVAFYASLAALASALMWLGCEAALMSGNPHAWLDRDTILTVLNSTQFGHIWRWRLILLAILPAFLALRFFRKETPLVWPILVSGGVLVVGLSGIGHGAMGTGLDAWIHLANQAIHLVATSVWVGGLLSLFYAIRVAHRTPSRDALITHILHRFSAVGFGAVVLILISGGVNSWFLVGSIHALLHTVYGHVLMVKVSLFLAMIGLALFNRLVVMKRLDHQGDTDSSVRLLIRSVAAEQIFAILVVASVSVLGTLTPAFDMNGMVM